MRSYWEQRYAEQGRRTVGHCSFSEDEFARRSDIALELLRSILKTVLEGKRVLDFGCGYGRMAKLLVEFCPFVVGVDIVEWAIEEARQHVPEAKFFALSDGRSLPFPDGFFGGVLSWTVLQHIEPENVTDVVVELGRVIEPGGVVVLYENISTWHEDKSHIWFRSAEDYEKLFRGYRATEKHVVSRADDTDEDHAIMVMVKE